MSQSGISVTGYYYNYHDIEWPSTRRWPAPARRSSASRTTGACVRRKPGGACGADGIPVGGTYLDLSPSRGLPTSGRTFVAHREPAIRQVGIDGTPGTQPPALLARDVLARRHALGARYNFVNQANLRGVGSGRSTMAEARQAVEHSAGLLRSAVQAQA